MLVRLLMKQYFSATSLEKDMNIDHIWYTTSIAKVFLICSLSKNRLHSKFTHTHSHNEFEKAMKQKTYIQKKTEKTTRRKKKQCCKTRAVFYNNNTVLKTNS